MRGVIKLVLVAVAVSQIAFACKKDFVEIVVVNKSGRTATQVTVSCQQVTQTIDSINTDREVKLRFKSSEFKPLGKFVLIAVTGQVGDTTKVEASSYDDLLLIPHDKYFIVIDSSKATIRTKRS